MRKADVVTFGILTIVLMYAVAIAIMYPHLAAPVFHFLASLPARFAGAVESVFKEIW
jgi:hypothetical protein